MRGHRRHGEPKRARSRKRRIQPRRHLQCRCPFIYSANPLPLTLCPVTAALPATPSRTQQFPVCPSVPQQFPVMVLEDSSTSQQLPASHSMSDDCCNLLEEYVRFCRRGIARPSHRCRLTFARYRSAISRLSSVVRKLSLDHRTAVV